MKFTVLEATTPVQKNPAIFGGKFYRILGVKPNCFGSSTPNQVAYAALGTGSVQYFSDDGIRHSSFDYFNNNYYFEEFKGTLQIECP